MKFLQEHALFITRFFLYITALIFPFFHPAIAVSHDLYTKITLLFLLPLSMIFGYFLIPPRWDFKKSLITLMVIFFVTSLIFFPFDMSLLFPFAVVLWGYFSTLLIFQSQGKFPFFATLEIFLLITIYYQLLQYSRSSEEVAQASEGINNLLIAILLFSFILHSLTLYISFFGGKSISKYKKELSLFAVIGIPLFLFIAFMIPPDFVKHQVVYNPLEPEPPLTPMEGDGFFDRRQGGGQEENFRNGKPLGKRKEKFPSELHNPNPDQQNQGGESSRSEQENPQPREKNRLEGVPSEMWEQFKSSQHSKGKQIAVMVIASEIQPIYAAESYLVRYEPQTGFLIDEQEMLNQLKNLHLISTWNDPEKPLDEKRSPYSIFYLSTLKDRVIAYRPFQIEPTIKDERYYPFEFSYIAISGVSISKPEDWKNLTLQDLSQEPNFSVEKYLSLNLSKEEEQLLKSHVKSLLASKNPSNYFDVLNSILESYRTYKYKLGFQEKTDFNQIKDFLFKTKEGDCTEFSAATALLLRSANIPARVVHGWIASRDLQTPAHVGGVYHLRKKIPSLQKYELKDLYLVTTAHRHAWVQVYFPKFGWVDIETTSFAIPPDPEFDPNAQDVVIPLIDEPIPLKKEKFDFPFTLFFTFVGSLIVLTLMVLYFYKVFLYTFLFFATRRYNPRATNYLNRLLYMKLYDYGFPKRKIYETPLDYISKVPQTERFAKLITELKFRISLPQQEKELRYQELLDEYKMLSQTLKPKTIWKKLKYLLSLKGIFYKQ
ncbi:MAG: transglutaminase domain-containing protein [Leptospiraceae bacterium]|nr:transglutaminase domain-containing protein [Leptospiraceae bacterium]MDW7975684.1 transglutaminase domain-containing protein [Leptospiraceae bacterium]